MAYSKEDLESIYDTSVQDSDTQTVVWNSGTVYFDDEVVEYQGKYYRALTKTISQVPGRSKAGIWRELTQEIDESPESVDLCAYGEKKTKDIKTQTVSKVKQKVDAKPSSLTSKTALKAVKSEDLLKKNEKPSTPSKKTPVKDINKPLAKKRTLKQVNDEKQSAVVKPLPVQSQEKIQNINKKMHLEQTDQHIVNEVLKEMAFEKIKGSNPDDHNITSNLILVQEIGPGITLKWESSHPSIISTKGEVTCPEDGDDVAVNISLTVKKNITSSTRFFTLWVKAIEKRYSDEECVDLVCDALSFEHIKGENIQAESIFYDLELLNEGLYDTEIFWASNNRDLLDETGHFNQEKLNKDMKIRLYAIIVKHDIERLKLFDLKLKRQD